MKTIVRYEAIDGSVFTTKDAARAHEAMIMKVTHQVLRLRPRYSLRDDEFVQQDAETVVSVQRALIVILLELRPDLEGNHHVDFALEASLPAGQYFLSRIMDDCAPIALAAAWGRIMCTDNWFREWAQPADAIQMNNKRL